ncbi:hypothetical protein B0J11DRAFT_158054 [Dendryphion nanum]|uniref:Uncharacterized protein n=1 Tax=Dendryphion nanum TaxID=256645 RepID=A0A9P9EDX8_9PLEO|nr:hypothetical protein B0J11DRAFT_158054 [Dendryphion nanum]
MSATITRPLPSAVTYHIATSPQPSRTPSSVPLKSTIHLPQSSTWSSGLHFHATHTEYLRLVQGAVFVRLGPTVQILSVKKGEEAVVVTVPRYARHEWGRAEEWIRKNWTGSVGPGMKVEELDEEVIVEEWTDPIDIDKALFFWNLNGVIAPTPGTQSRPESALFRVARWLLGSWWIDFQLLVIFWELDNYPVLFELVPLLGREGGGVLEWFEYAVEYLVTYGVLFVASLVGRLVGVEAVREERTPEALWKVWRERKEGGKKTA